MRAPRFRPREPDRSAIGFGDSVFRSQSLLAGAVGLVVCITVGLSDSDLDTSAPFFAGVTLIIWATIVSAVTPWLRFHIRWQAVVPLADIIAISMLREAAPDSGFGGLLIFPVIWLATTFGRLGSILGPVFAISILWVQTTLAQLGVLDAPSSLTAAASLTVALAFTSAVMHMTSRRVMSQRVLLRRQTRMLERALTRARIQEATVREAFDAVEFAVISLDLDGNTITANRATWALLTELGLPENTPWDRFPLYRSDKLTPVPANEYPHRRVLAGDAVDGETYVVGHRTGTRFTIHLSARLLHDQTGVVDRVVLVLRDVSAEVRAITDRDDLVTSMSHELRTPLSSVLGYVDLALEVDGLPDEARTMLDIALVNTQRLNALVNDLLAARSTSAAHAISLTLEVCDVSALVAESIDAVSVRASERLIPITLRAAERVCIPADAFRLRQVFDNLLSNAIKYNHIGGRITVTVDEVGGGDESGRVEIRVSDTGRGMTMEEQKGLFERFYRAESVRGSTVHGTGLGLSISREIVVLHGGTIEIASESGRGTEVIVSMPRTAARPPRRPTATTEDV